MNFNDFLNAIERNNIELVKQFLDNKDFNPSEEDNIAFIYACYYEYTEIVKLFIGHNIHSFTFDYNKKDNFYYLKTIYSTLKNDVDKYLIKKEKLIIELQKKHYL